MVENIASGLDQADEWYLNTTSGELLIILTDAEDPSQTPVTVPQLDQLVNISDTHSIRYG